MDTTAIITTTITAIASVVVALSNLWMNSQRKKDKVEAQKIAERNSAKNSIQNMITQDIIRVELLQRNPENHKAILDEYDKYSASGGNSYIKEQVKDYCKWYQKKKTNK